MLVRVCPGDLRWVVSRDVKLKYVPTIKWVYVLNVKLGCVAVSCESVTHIAL